MKKYLIFLLALALAGCKGQQNGINSDGDKKTNEFGRIAMCEQSTNTYRIYSIPGKVLKWWWKAPEEYAKLFDAPDEVKPVMGGKKLLVTASGGAVALIDIATREMTWIVAPMGNPHSAELLPDGNVVTASSHGWLSVYETGKGQPADSCQKIDFPSAHSAVWDKKRNCLWSAGSNKLRRYSYSDGRLSLVRELTIPTSGAHDLMPLYGEGKLVLTTETEVYIFNPSDNSFTIFEGKVRKDVKCVSTGAKGMPAICIIPTKEWWTESILDYRTGETVFQNEGFKLYKARWMTENSFSY